MDMYYTRYFPGEERQIGFSGGGGGRSCTDQIATLRIIVEQSIEWNSYVNFDDNY